MDHETAASGTNGNGYLDEGELVILQEHHELVLHVALVRQLKKKEKKTEARCRSMFQWQ